SPINCVFFSAVMLINQVPTGDAKVKPNRLAPPASRGKSRQRGFDRTCRGPSVPLRRGTAGKRGSVKTGLLGSRPGRFGGGGFAVAGRGVLGLSGAAEADDAVGGVPDAAAVGLVCRPQTHPFHSSVL